MVTLPIPEAAINLLNTTKYGSNCKQPNGDLWYISFNMVFSGSSKIYNVRTKKV